MDKAKLNRRVTQYRKDLIAHKNEGGKQSKDIDTDAFWKERERLKEEGSRLYRLDPTFELMNAKSIRTIIRANSALRFQTPHMFGISIDYEKI